VFPAAPLDPKVPAAHPHQRLQFHLLTRAAQQPLRALALPGRLPVRLDLIHQVFQSVPGSHYSQALQALQEIPQSLAVQCLQEVRVNHWIRENPKIPGHLACRSFRLLQENRRRLMDREVLRHPENRRLRKVRRVPAYRPSHCFRLHRWFRELRDFRRDLMVPAVRVLQPIPRARADQGVPGNQSHLAVLNQVSRVARPVLAGPDFQQLQKVQTDQEVQHCLVIQLVQKDQEIRVFQLIPGFLIDQVDL